MLNVVLFKSSHSDDLDSRAFCEIVRRDGGFGRGVEFPQRNSTNLFDPFKSLPKYASSSIIRYIVMSLLAERAISERRNGSDDRLHAMAPFQLLL